jgi:hypothetical protein
MQPYGLSLDNRKTITKLDWEVWTATLTDGPQQFKDPLHRLVRWADTTPSRVPETDFYDTVSGRQKGVQARSVVGGLFIKALLDPFLIRRLRNDGNWSSRHSRRSNSEWPLGSVLVLWPEASEGNVAKPSL